MCGMDATKPDDAGVAGSETSDTETHSRRSTILLLTGVVAIGVMVGVAVFWVGSVVTAQPTCVDAALAPIACTDPAAWGSVLATVDADTGGDAANLLDACPAETMDVVVLARGIACVGAPDGRSWARPGDVAGFNTGSCVDVPPERLAVPTSIECSDPHSFIIKDVVVLEPASSDAAAADEYGLQVGDACKTGAALGPSLFEWKAGASEIICVVP